MSIGRSYRSTLREQRALDTHLRIREAAAALFAERGFTETTVAAIAEQAGVATPTVYARYGSKAGIVLDMLEHLEETADMEPRVAEMKAEPDPYRQLSLFCAWIRTLWENGAPILRAAQAAMATPDVAALSSEGDERRRRATMEACEVFAAKGVLRTGLEPAAGAEQFWLLTSLGLYFDAVDRLGWTADQYEAWLAGILEHLLLEPRSR